MLPDGRRLGAHLALGHGMVGAAERARAIGARAIQVFADNPTAWRRRESLPRELPAFRRILADADIAPISVHAAYVVNLAGDDPVAAERSCALLARELETPGMDESYDAVNLARARDIAAGRLLEPLPPERLEVRSSRDRSAPAEDIG